MDKDKIIDGLRMTMDLCVFDPSTGEEIDPDMLNDINRATYDACKGALEILERLDTDSDTISRQAVLSKFEPWLKVDGYNEGERNILKAILYELRFGKFATDTNVGRTDTISRAKAIDGKICIRRSNGVEIYDDYVVPVEYLEQLPSTQPEIVTCDRCVATKLGECIWHNAGATYCSLGEVEK